MSYSFIWDQIGEEEVLKRFYDLEKTLLDKNSEYIEEYGFIKLLSKSLNKNEILKKNLNKYIKIYCEKYEVSDIVIKTELFNELKYIFDTYLKDWDNKNQRNYEGSRIVEEYHILSKKIIREFNKQKKHYGHI